MDESKSSTERLIHIKDRLRRDAWEKRSNEEWGVWCAPEAFYAEDVLFLLAKIDKLERENHRLRQAIRERDELLEGMG